MPTNKAGVFTYSGDPNANAKDQTRFLVGDTDPDDPQLLDGEIEWVLSQFNNTPINAAIQCCEAIMLKYARQVDEAVGPVKINFSQRMKNYQQVQNQLRQRLAMTDCAPFSGGITYSDKKTNNANTDIIRPDFTKHMMENDQIAPWTTEPQYWLWLNFAD